MGDVDGTQDTARGLYDHMSGPIQIQMCPWRQYRPFTVRYIRLVNLDKGKAIHIAERESGAFSVMISGRGRLDLGKW